MDITHLEEFIALADTLNFSAVARQRYITTATLSKHISALEAELDDELFVRDSHHVRLTTAGKLFLEDAKIIVNGYQKARLRLASRDDAYDSICRLGYLRMASVRFLADFVKAFERTKPRTKLILQRMGYREVISALQLGQIDLAFLLDLDANLRRSCEFCCVEKTHYEIITSASHPFSQLDEVSIENVRAEQRIFLPDPYRYPGLHQFELDVLKRDPNGRGAQLYRDLDTLMLWVEMGKGIAMSAAFNKLAYPGVSFVPVSDVDLSCDVCVAWPKDTPDQLKGAYREVLQQARLM